jgi:hypothetical protein
MSVVKTAGRPYKCSSRHQPWLGQALHAGGCCLTLERTERPPTPAVGLLVYQLWPRPCFVSCRTQLKRVRRRQDVLNLLHCP